MAEVEEKSLEYRRWAVFKQIDVAKRLGEYDTSLYDSTGRIQYDRKKELSVRKWMYLIENIRSRVYPRLAEGTMAGAVLGLVVPRGYVCYTQPSYSLIQIVLLFFSNNLQLRDGGIMSLMAISVCVFLAHCALACQMVSCLGSGGARGVLASCSRR